METIEVTSKKNTGWSWVVFGLILGVGGVLRLWMLDGESLRLDEAQSIWQASHSLEFIRAYMLKNVHLPLHNSLLHIWMTYFGSGEIAVRMFAVIPGILGIPALYVLAREFLKKEWALLAMAIAALSPFWIWYSREIRMYSLLALIVTLSYYFFFRILKRGNFWHYAGYVAINVIGIYTHYLFILAILMQVIFFLTTWRVVWNEKKPDKKQALIRFVIVGIIIAAAFAPWLYALINNYGSGSQAPTLDEPRSFNIFLTLFEFFVGYQPNTATTMLVALWPFATLIGFIFLARRHPISDQIYFLVLATLMPIAIVYVVSKVAVPMFLSRYLIIVTPPLYIFLAWFISELKGKTRLFIMIIFGTILIGSLVNQLTNPNVPTREDYRAAAEFIQDEVNPRDVVVMSPPYLLYPFQYYYQGKAQITTIPIWDKRKGGIPQVTEEELAKDAEIIKGNHRRIFLLVGLDLVGALQTKQYFDFHLTKLDKRQFSANLWLHVYQAEYLPEIKENEEKQQEELIVHKVVADETLSGIAKKYYKDASEYRKIQKINNLIDPDVISIGQILTIPR